MRLTLIELMIVIAVIVISIPAVLFFLDGSGTNNYSVGVNGMVEERCIGGYKFVIGNKGQPTQVLDQYGKGSPC